jgi:uncharacterized protein (TIGR02600 family)
MKSLNSSFAPTAPARQRGVALVIVLAFLVLMSTLLIAFLSSMQSELSSSKGYAATMSARQLSDTAVQAAMGAVMNATSQGRQIAWASQPGMIKTYGLSGGSASAEPYAFYKLYSSNRMVLPGSEATQWDPAQDVDGWLDRPELFTDLNEPMLGRNDVLRYPILDPRAADKDSTGQPKVRGMRLLPGTPASTANRAPMPVRWVYVLKDGTLTVPDSSSSDGVAEWEEIEGRLDRPSTENPIVGRVAFWTDDDTCKINLNTAGGDVWDSPEGPDNYAGSYWETPRVDTIFDKTFLARNQPRQKEYQRYAGHPATTYLSAVFPTWSRAELMDVLPRLSDENSSKGGTVMANPEGVPKPVVPDTDRLFASVDELMFLQVGLPQSYGTLRPRALTDNLTREEVDLASFFLTASSRAPEVNLWNMPRVSMWPIHRDDTPSRRTPYDRLIAFCSTFGGVPTDSARPGYRYYFQRTDPRNQTVDLDDNNPTGRRNRELYQYLNRLLGSAVPGYGLSWDTKYTPQDREQLVLSLYDYIRSTNLLDTSMDTSGPTSFQTFAPRQNSAGYGEVFPAVDSRNNRMGYGRFTTLSEVAIQFYFRREDPRNPANPNDPPAGSTRVRMQAVILLEPYGVSQGFAMYHPNHIYRAEGLSNFRINQGRMNPGDAPGNIGFLAAAQINANTFSGGFWHQRGWCGPMGPQPLIGNLKDPMLWSGARAPYQFCSREFFVDVPTSAYRDNSARMRMEGQGGGPIRFSIATRLTAGGADIQKIHFEFDPVDLPLPKRPANPNADDTNPDTGYTNYEIRRVATRDDSRKQPRRWRQLIQPEDVVRSVEINPNAGFAGDPRLYAIQKEIPVRDSTGEKYYIENRSYREGTLRLVHSLRTASGFCYPNDEMANPEAYGRLVRNVNYHHRLGEEPYTMRPNLSSRFVNGAQLGGQENIPGDWDTGVGPACDGAYIGKADDGQLDIRGYEGELRIPYYSEQRDPPKSTFFTPNRVVTGPVLFGSLPTQAATGKGWQTLAFSPFPAAGTAHPGLGQRLSGGAFARLPDHVLLDLFHMPVVEPYAISEPFSTAGRVNLNYQILPFTYIERSTALQGVLRGVRIPVISGDAGNIYKNTATMPNIRKEINIEETIKAFTQRFEDRSAFRSGNTFRSASEICEMPLVPIGRTLANTRALWAGQDSALTGDNLRERPYSIIYPRITTKSNTYTVHVRAQVLAKNRTKDASTWDEQTEAVLSEYRGSVTFERYIDAADPRLPDYAAASNFSQLPNLDQFYRTRVISSKRFTP